MDIFLGLLFIVICLLLIVVVLLQKGRGGGLGAAFGAGSSSAFGTKTGDVFTWVTIVLTALFLVLAIGANFAFRPIVQQVARPEFVPPQGRISGPVDVAIFSRTGGADIRYTTDGGEPTRQSSKYNVRLAVTPPMTLKARAFLKGMKDSEIVTAVYSLGERVPSTQSAESLPATEPASRPATLPAEKPTTLPAGKPAEKAAS